MLFFGMAPKLVQPMRMKPLFTKLRFSFHSSHIKHSIPHIPHEISYGELRATKIRNF